MKYERLTEKAIGCFGYDLKDFEYKPKEFNDCNAFYAYKTAVGRLGELEDKIESGEIDYVADSKTEQTITDLLIEFDEMGFAPTTVCPNAEQTAIEWKEQIVKEIQKLQAENAELRATLSKMETVEKELRERLKKAVELPFENLDKVFILAGEDTKAKQFIPARIVEGTIVGFGYDVYEWANGNYKFNYHVLVGENNYILALEQFNKTLFKTREAAEARLKEIKEEQND